MGPIKRPRLELSRETLRLLADDELSRAASGGTVTTVQTLFTYCICQSTEPVCPPSVTCYTQFCN